jgi:hypothetical protein
MPDLKMDITCPHCKATGYAVWEAEGMGRGRWKPNESRQVFM